MGLGKINFEMELGYRQNCRLVKVLNLQGVCVPSCKLAWWNEGALN